MSTTSYATATEAVMLPKFLHDHRAVLIEAPIRIIVIIVAALIIRALSRRAIDRAVRPVRGDVPRILRPFKERLENSTFLESSGLMSERRALRAATLGSVLKSASSAIIFVIAFLLILSELRINLAPFIAGTSIVGVALGFGAQNIVKDFLTGMFMLLEDQYGVGDVIDFEYATGTSRPSDCAQPDCATSTARSGTCATAKWCASATRARASRPWFSTFPSTPGPMSTGLRPPCSTSPVRWRPRRAGRPCS